MSDAPAPGSDLFAAIDNGLLGEHAWSDTLPARAGDQVVRLDDRRAAMAHATAV